MKSAFTLSHLIEASEASRPTQETLTLEQLSLVRGGQVPVPVLVEAAKAAAGAAAAEQAVKTTGNLFERLVGPTVDRAGKEMEHWFFDSTPPPQPTPPPPAPYEPPVMSAEPNMSMQGGGNGTNGIPSEITYVANEAGTHW